MEHDTTDVRIEKPSEATLQRKTFSIYYGRKNILKGGVANTTSGFNVAFPLYTAIMDSDYLIACNVFKQQDAILQDHLKYVATLPTPPDLKISRVCNVVTVQLKDVHL